MRAARLLRIGPAAAIGAVLATGTWWLAEGYRDAHVCLDALPALEERGDLVADHIQRSGSLGRVIEIGYLQIDDSGSRLGRLRCAFGDDLDGRRQLLGLEFGGRPLGEARLYVLERFWLEDEAAVQSGRARLRVEITPLGFLAAMIGRPHPALVGGLLCALLAAAMLAARRFAGGRRRD
ncbi:hypothetical protein CXZ10_02745 [Pleomorphomonas diazotrophica]|uniref:Uncharacterized protein n=1 Tax=Pleomorphomonas diazotrophica TaxID=1166257 RepID=A0A1I4QYY7_9HYPH|nr:hypothetical protein [Pleomorphomonas diazotrophica]PKR90318.1 hypothetical protein CXZ10_02745 [Pleomorphomonas diazotrophica]SFM45282.1 hypothetical protein SAMN05192571_101771 [Pleomorphomonas diazotrophica]